MLSCYLESAERPRNGARKQEEPVMVNPLLSRKEKVKTILNDEVSNLNFFLKSQLFSSMVKSFNLI